MGVSGQRLLVAFAASAALAGCADTTRDKIKKEAERFDFLVLNDGSKQEKCASMRRLRDLNADLKDKEFYGYWSDAIKRDC